MSMHGCGQPGFSPRGRSFQKLFHKPAAINSECRTMIITFALFISLSIPLSASHHRTSIQADLTAVRSEAPWCARTAALDKSLSALAYFAALADAASRAAPESVSSGMRRQVSNVRSLIPAINLLSKIWRGHKKWAIFDLITSRTITRGSECIIRHIRGRGVPASQVPEPSVEETPSAGEIWRLMQNPDWSDQEGQEYLRLHGLHHESGISDAADVMSEVLHPSGNI